MLSRLSVPIAFVLGAAAMRLLAPIHVHVHAPAPACAPPAASVPVMWADSVLGYSSQYTESSWSAAQALGMPNVYPEHGDLPQAWASKTPDDQAEWIEVGYAQPRAVSAVEIYETYNPRAIDSVELVTTSGRRIHLLPPGGEAVVGARKLVLPVACTNEPIAAVRINIASHLVAGWNEIDAVGLVPCTADATTVNRR